MKFIAMCTEHQCGLNNVGKLVPTVSMASPHGIYELGFGNLKCPGELGRLSSSTRDDCKAHWQFVVLNNQGDLP